MTGSQHVEAVGSELTVVANMTIFSNIMPCNPAEVPIHTASIFQVQG
jgi:hypothetical protein